MSVQKAKGTRAETAAERECLAWGLTARRIDMGRGIGDLEVYWSGATAADLAYVGAPHIIVQVKDNKDYNRTKPPTAWLDQAHQQAEKAGAALGILVVKPAGVGYRNVPDWHAWLMLSDLMTLLGTASPDQFETTRFPVRVPFGSILTLLGGTAPT